MKIQFGIADRERLLLKLRELATIVELENIYFDPYSEFGFSRTLISSGFPEARLIEEPELFAKRQAAAPASKWPKVGDHFAIDPDGAELIKSVRKTLQKQKTRGAASHKR